LQLVTVGSPVSIDGLQAGTSFGADPEGDAVTYSLSLSATTHGLQVTGLFVSGIFDSFGAVRARITATDTFGARSFFDFVIAAPFPEPGRPNLPGVSYTYDPTKLLLPPLMKAGLAGGGPFGDTTPADNPTTDAGATLGRVLFFDKRLSSTNSHSCSSCHEQRHGFANSTRFSVGATGEESRRNSMGLSNVGFNRENRFFSDVRVASLESLALLPIEDSTELANSMPALVAKLSATDFYPPLFEAAFGTPEVSADRITKALAQFLRSLKSYRAPWDLFANPLEGENSVPPASVFSAEAQEGQSLFRDLSCGACHRDVLQFMRDPSSNGLDDTPTDSGAGEGRFRSASLRNVTHTAPYMHDGRFASLREVIDHYDHGMKSVDPSTTALVDPVTGGPKRFNLTEAQKVALEAFLRVLTDDAFLTDPKFSDPFL
jgi:cytochrome c peroxidase